jgi:hypothetical protein
MHQGSDLKVNTDGKEHNLGGVLPGGSMLPQKKMKFGLQQLLYHSIIYYIVHLHTIAQLRWMQL